MRINRSLCFLALFLAAAAAAGHCGTERTILALYDSTDPLYNKTDYNFIHLSAEMPLNYLGMRVRYHDIAEGLPPSEDMRDVRGVITWFEDDAMPDAAAYCEWAAGQIAAGKKYVIVDGLGALTDSVTGKAVPLDVVNSVFGGLKLRYEAGWTDNPFVIEVEDKDPSMVEFERTLSGETWEYEKIVPLSPDCSVYLELDRTDIPDGKSAAVVTTPAGGFVLDGYALYDDYINRQKSWRIDPFLFFSEAFALEGMPAFDTTTLLGKRVFYSHIDGDGLRNISQEDNRTYSGRVIKDEILEKYDLPITASFITCEVDERYFGTPELVNLAKDILALPNIEAGVHGFSHPLDWAQKLTAFAIKGYSRKMYGEEDSDLMSESAYGAVCVVTVPWGEYLQDEIPGAVGYLDSHAAPEGKPVKIYQWTGNCKPTGDAIALTYKTGVRNINGGDTRFDRAYPSYTGVAPLTRQVNGETQVYTSNSNENIYTNGWTGPFDGFRQVIETFQQTETPTLVKAPPRRVTPMNVYYHYYSAEREDSLDALKEVYDYVLTQDIIPIATSRYVSMVGGFLSGTIDRLDDGAWRFRDHGSCATVRISGTGKYPDLARSQNILGFTVWEDYTYVHLAGPEEATLYFMDIPPVKAYLVSSTVEISGADITAERATFRARAYGDGVCELANMTPGGYILTAGETGGKGEIFRKKIRASKDGRLLVNIPRGKDLAVTVVRGK